MQENSALEVCLFCKILAKLGSRFKHESGVGVTGIGAFGCDTVPSAGKDKWDSMESKLNARGEDL